MATITVRAPVRASEEKLQTRNVLRHAARAGMIGGVALVYLAATGIIERFRAKPIITGVLDLGFTFVLLVLLFTGFLATRAKNEDGERVVLPAPWRLGAGALAGAIAGAFLSIFILLFSAINLRQIFINISPSLVEDTLSFGQGATIGSALMLVVGTAIAAVGAAMTFLGRTGRQVLLSGAVAVLFIGLLEQLFRVMLDTLGLETGWLYTGGGLTVTGAVIVFVVTAVVGFVWARRRQLLAGILVTEEDEAAGRGRLLDRVAVWLGVGAAVLAFALAGIGIASEDPLDAIPITVIAVALVVALVALILGGARSKTIQTSGEQRGRGSIGYVAAGAAIAAIIPLVAGSFLSNTLVTVMIYILLGLGLNIVVGLAGLLDLGYVAFFAIGAYGLGLLTSPLSGLVTEGVGEFGAGSQVAGEPLTNFWVAVPFVVLATLIWGILLGAPVVRLRGDYLAIVTLGFGEIIRVVVQSDWTASLLGGSQGLKQIPAPPPETLDFRSPQKLYYLVLIASLLMAYVTWRLQYSRVGRAWAAMREDESVAEGMGISVIKYKLLAFAMGAAVASLGGIFFAAQLSVTTPESFQLLVSIQVLAVIVLGGMGSVTGVIVGAFVLMALPELLREFAEYRLLFYGAALVAIMILRPEGLVPNVRRRRELHERQIEEGQYAERVGASGTEPELTANPTPTVPTQREEQIE